MNDNASEKNNAGNYRTNKNKITTAKSFEYKTELIGSAPAVDDTLDTQILPIKIFESFLEIS